MRDITIEDTVDFKFTTTEPDTGAPATLSGTPVISAYVGNGTTQITAGITLSVDFDAVTGLNNVRVAATAANGYAAGTDVALIITTGTVDAVSAVGYKVAEFTISRAAAFTRLGAPAGASVSADVAAVKVDTAAILVDTGTTLDGRIPAALVGGRMDANMGAISADATAADNLEAAFDDTVGAIPWLGIIDQGTAQSATATTLVLRAATALGSDDACLGATLWAFGSTQGYWQARIITDYTTADDTATVDTWDVTPSGTITYKIFGSAPTSTSVPVAANVTQWAGSAVATPTTAGVPEVDVTFIEGVDATDQLDAHAAAGLDAAGVRAAVGLASANLDTQLGDLPTNAELATSQASADDATLAVIATLQTSVDDLPTSAELATALGTADDAVLAAVATVDTVVDAIKVKTDSLTFTTAGMVDSAVKRVGDTTLTAAGTGGQGYGAA